MEILDIIQQDDILLLFFKEWENLQAIVDRQEELKNNNEQWELNYYEIWISKFSFLWNSRDCIYLWFDKETEMATKEKNRLLYIKNKHILWEK